MAMNGAARHNRNTRHVSATSMSGTQPSDLVNHQELFLNTSLGTIRNSAYSQPLSANGHSLSWQSEIPSVSRPIQAVETPPDSQEADVGNTDVTVTGRYYRSTSVQHSETSTATQKKPAVKDAATRVTESMLQRQPERKAAANFKPKDVTIKSVDAVKKDHKTRKMTVLFIGNIAVGKTSLINRIRHKQYQPIHNATIDITPTMIGATVRGQNYIVRLLDTAGEERFQSVMQTFYRHGNGAMVVYDLTDYDSFDKITDWKLKLQVHCASEDFSFPTILLGNKADKSEKHINGSEMADDLKMDGFFKTSAKTGEGITDAVKLMIYLIDLRCRNDLKFLSQDGPVIVLQQQGDQQPKPSGVRYPKC